MTKIKICGLTRPEDIDAVNEALPDYIGFVFAESRRHITAERAALLKARLDKRIKAVGVFVNAAPAEIAAVCRAGVIDLIQLHGNEGEDDIISLKQLTDKPVIKAVRVRSAGQILIAEALPAEFLLLDAYKKGVYGGTGETFDYSKIPALNKPFFLAGGLNAGNISKAASVGAYCLDISGGVETDGVKDRRKILEIIRSIREEG